MTDYFRGKTLICEQTKPRTYFTPVFQRIGDGLKLHHMEVDCLGYRQPKKMLPIEHMGKHKRRIFELETENAKLRELVRDMWRFTGTACKKYPRLFDPAAQGGQMVQLNMIDAFEQRMRELGVEAG